MELRARARRPAALPTLWMCAFFLVFAGCGSDTSVSSAKDAAGADTGSDAAPPVKPCQSSADCPAVAVPCQAAACQPNVGCIVVVLADGAVCDDGNACTTSDLCQQGNCQPGKQMPCQDGDPCTADTCQPGQGCSHEPAIAGTPCEDGNSCTQNDSCTAGKCVAGADTCGCQSDADCAKYEDGDACNGAMYCDKSAPSAPKCTVNPATVVSCKTAFDSACLKNACHPVDGTCAPIAIEDAVELCDTKGVCHWQVRLTSDAKPQVVPCDDGDACTTPDLCAAGTCVSGKTNVCGCKSNAECLAQDDGNLCNGLLFCNNGKVPAVCEVNPATVVTCPSVDDSTCSKNECNAKSGICAFVSKNEGLACDDGNPCTQGEVCKTGTCGGAPNKCVCNSDAECADQDDGDLCNGTMYCDLQAGACKINPATVVVCPSVDDTYCLVNSCISKTGLCAFTAVHESLACDDGNPCTPSETCDKGQCVASGAANTCQCQADADCAKFDDADLCNGKLYCDKQVGKCTLNPATIVKCSSSFDTTCEQNLCNAKSGTCAPQPVHQGQACADGNPCTTAEACDLGACKAGASVCECQNNGDCQAKDDGNYCNGTMFCNKSALPYACAVNPATVVKCPSVDDTFCAKNECQPKTGVCELGAAHQGLACDDGSKCTSGDLCKNGACGGAPVPCQDDQPCTADACDPLGGCKSAPDAKLCNDDNPCTTDLCSALQGCQYLAAAGPCDDGSACTTGDKCAGTFCAGKALACDDGNPCTDDTCDPVKGCTHAANTAGCTTGTPCAPDGTCKDSKCEALPTPLFKTIIESGDVTAAAVLVNPSGQALAIGSLLNGTAIVAARTDPFGKVLWQQTIAPASANGAAATGDDGAVVVGKGQGMNKDQDGYLMRLGADGAAKWKQVAGGAEADELLAVTTFGVDEIAAAGRKGSAAWLVRVSSVGTVLWQKTYGAGEIRAVAVMADGGFVLAGANKDASGKAVLAVLRTDADGKLAWQKDLTGLTGKANAVVALADGGVLAGGSQGPSARLVRLDAKGNVVWDLLYGGNEAGEITAMSLQPQGMLAVAGIRAGKVWLMRTDVNGTEVWQRTLGEQNGDTSPALAVAADGSHWLASTGAGSAAKIAMTLQRTDAWGHAACSDQGDCAGKKSKDCDDTNLCTNDACLALLGCTHTVNALACDDGNACTANDFCNQGACAKGSSGSCEDGNPCTLDECDTEGGCNHSPLTGPCSDNNFCTKGDACVSGLCKPGTADTCGDGNDCTDDACDKAKGCNHTPNSASCNAGDCTYDDACSGGFCKSSGKPAFLDVWAGGPYNDRAGRVAQVGEAGFVMAGLTYPTAHPNGLVTRVDASGAKMWDAVVSTGDANADEHITGIVPTPFGFMATGYTSGCAQRGLVARLDAAGKLVYLKIRSPVLNDGDCNGYYERGYFYDLVDGQDGSFAAVGQRFGGENHGWFMRIDHNGAILSNVSLGGQQSVLRGVARAGGSGYFGAGYTTAASAGGWDGWLVRLDGAGNAMWSKRIGGAGNDYFYQPMTAPDGGAYAVGNTASGSAGLEDAWLVRFDPAGNVLWQRSFGGIGSDGWLGGVVRPGGSLALVGATQSQGAGGQDAWLAGLDAEGNLHWQALWGNAGDDVWQDAVLLKSGGLALTGYGAQAKQSQHDFRLVLTDAFGHGNCLAAGACFAKAAADCDDNNPCTKDSCEALLGCGHAAFADGTQCPGGKKCAAAVCN